MRRRSRRTRDYLRRTPLVASHSPQHFDPVGDATPDIADVGQNIVLDRTSPVIEMQIGQDVQLYEFRVRKALLKMSYPQASLC